MHCKALLSSEEIRGGWDEWMRWSLEEVAGCYNRGGRGGGGSCEEELMKLTGDCSGLGQE